MRGVSKFRFREEAMRRADHARKTYHDDGTVSDTAGRLYSAHRCRVCGLPIREGERERWSTSAQVRGVSHDRCGFWTPEERARMGGAP